MLALMRIAPSHGQSPRFFRLLEDHRRILVAHQNGNSLTCLAMNADGSVGDLKQTLAVEQPAFIGRR
jgi:6-phosphogluconolactonase